MGSYISRELRNVSVPYLVIEKDENLRVKLERENYLYLYGNASEDEVLLEAGVNAVFLLENWV